MAGKAVWRIARWVMAAGMIGGLATATRGQDIFVTSGNTVGEYDAATGAVVNASLITGLDGPSGLALSGSDLFVANFNSGTIGEYNAITGAAINATLVTGLQSPVSLAVLGTNLYVTNFGSDKVGEYNASTGAAINANLITGLNGPWGLSLAGSDLYVSIISGLSNSTIGIYNATTGAAINATLVSGLVHPFGLALMGSDLFASVGPASIPSPGNLTKAIGVYNASTGAAINATLVDGLSNPDDLAVSGADIYVAVAGNGTVGEYNATTGAAVNATLISGLNGTFGIVIGTVPEPAEAGLCGALAAVGAVVWRRRLKS
jgi:hypothetical protein